ncbi:MAG: hypothetical protein ACYDDI_07880 [Candidatus Acidiferrales bacterium]
MKILAAMFIGVFVLFLIAVSGSDDSGTDSAAPSSTVESPQQKKQDNMETQAMAASMELRGLMRNPESYDPTSVLVPEKYSGPGTPRHPIVTCIEYRAQNGFGGLNDEFAVVKFDVSATLKKGTTTFLGRHVFIENAAAWNRYCRGNSYDETTYGSAETIKIYKDLAVTH